MNAYLGVDMGGTASRWCLTDVSGEEIARGRAPGASGLVQDPKIAAALTAALTEIAAALPQRPSTLYCGLTGAGFEPKPAIRTALAEAFGLPEARIGQTNDMVLAWHAAFPDGGPGHLVSAGTGSIGITLRPDGTAVSVGGRGILIDDAGSGAWIALRALDAVLRRFDETGGPEGCETLAEALAARMGGIHHDAVTAYVYRGSRGDVGLLSVAVAEAARAGDPLALDVFARAGRELLRLAQTLTARAGPAEIVFTGGALDLHPMLREEIEAGAAGLPGLRFATLDPARRAAELARAAAMQGP